MKNYLRIWLGTLAAALMFGTSPVAAAIRALPGDVPSARRETLWGLPRNDPAIAVGAILAALVLFTLIAWIAARVGDKS